MLCKTILLSSALSFTSELEFMFAKFKRPSAIPKIFFKIKNKLIINYYAISYGIGFKQN
jgi:hypothetical protein